MKLLDLDPKWIMKDGRRVGFTFVSPADPKWRQSCFAIPSPSTRDQWELFDTDHVQSCKPGIAWSIAGGIEAADFATLTVMPSIDGSAGGLWHGFITSGEMR
jgi:hypothetical protein